MKRWICVILAGVMSMLTGCAHAQPRLMPQEKVEHSFEEVSVHDPAIIQGEDGSYYIFGSHLAVAKTEDLMNWSYVNRGVKDKNSVIPQVFTQMKEAFAWSQSATFWAPDVVRLKDGSYALYYCNCRGDSPLSCLGLAKAKSVAGPYENQGLLLRSGMGAEEKNEDGKVYQATTDPNVVDPAVFYDKTGQLWMIYGSYSGGIFAKKLDGETGLPLEQGYGKKLLGGNHLRIEAPYVLYNPETEYYYLFLSFGGLDSDGGYNVRVCRSQNPDGPYEDSLGNDMIDCKGPSGTMFSDGTAQRFGTKLMGGYRFEWKQGEEGEQRRGHLSPGHNSCLYQEESGKFFLIFHSRFEGRGEEHEVRVHQMFFNDQGWPVIAPYRYVGERLEQVEEGEIPGAYKLINHGREINTQCIVSQEIYLEKNGKISGAVEGTWQKTGESSIELTIGEDAYSGVLLRQWDEDGKKNVMTFSALCQSTGTAIWGSGMSALE